MTLACTDMTVAGFEAHGKKCHSQGCQSGVLSFSGFDAQVQNVALRDINVSRQNQAACGY